MKKTLMFLVLAVLISGCNQQNNQTSYNNREENQNPQPITVRNSDIEQQQNREEKEISQHLVEIAASVPKVEDATAVVLGNYAFVGIDVDSSIERSEVGTIKYSVAEALKDDPHGAKAMIVADPDLYARLQEVGDDMENGRPVQGILNELADIAGRLMPELPKDAQQIDPEEAPEESREKVDQPNEGKLKKEQQDQSNNHLDR